MTTMPTNLLVQLAELGATIAGNGIEASAAEAAELVALARTRGVRSEALRLVTDPSQPAVVRERAVAIVSMQTAAAEPANTAFSLAV